jgi:hypothetical protein
VCRCLKFPLYQRVHCVVAEYGLLIFLTLFLIINIPHDVWIVDNILLNNYTLDECTYHCITYSVTAHPDDGQARPKHVGATNWENIYHLCILLVFISNFSDLYNQNLSKTSRPYTLFCSTLNQSRALKTYVNPMRVSKFTSLYVSDTIRFLQEFKFHLAFWMNFSPPWVWHAYSLIRLS